MLLNIYFRKFILSPKRFFGEDYWSKCVSNFWRTHKESNLRIRSFVIRNPRLATKAFLGHLFIPVLSAELSDTHEGRAIQDALDRRVLSGLFSLGFFGACVLRIPADAADYSAGASKQTLRRKVRAARRSGVTWRSVTKVEEQRELINALHAVLSTKTRIRLEGNDWSNLIGSQSWTVGYGPADEPLLIAVTPHDGQWAVLHLFVTLGEAPIHSDARYYLTQVIVEKLSASGVKYLLDTDSSDNLPAGLWHFQRMLGFGVARVRVARTKSKIYQRVSCKDRYASAFALVQMMRSDHDTMREGWRYFLRKISTHQHIWTLLAPSFVLG